MAKLSQSSIRLFHVEPLCGQCPDTWSHEPNTNSHCSQTAADTSLDIQCAIVADSVDCRQRRVAQAERDDASASANHDKKTCCALRKALYGVSDTNEVHAVEGEIDYTVRDDDGRPVPFCRSLGCLSVNDSRHNANDHGKSKADETILGLENSVVPHTQALDGPITAIAGQGEENHEAHDLASLDIAERVESEVVRRRHQNSGKGSSGENV